MPSPLILENEVTWPSELRRLLDEGVSTLQAFWKEQAKIELMREEDVALRANAPANSHQQAKDEIYDAAGQTLVGLDIIGWHCSRLCNDEIDVLLRDGMYPLSRETFTARLQRKVLTGTISATTASRLEAKNQARDLNRCDRLWFIFSEGSLRREDGVRRLFASWGGEALYNLHDEDPSIVPLLRAIGTPCIVEAVLPIERVRAHSTPAEWVVRAFLARRGISDGQDPECEGNICEPVAAERISRVVCYGGANFEALTGASNWRQRLNDDAASRLS